MNELIKSLGAARFRQKNTEKRCFVPETVVASLMTESAVRSALKDAQIPAHDIPDLTAGIVAGARKCFAILILMGQANKIRGFFTRDELQQSTPDGRLPYSPHTLEQIFELPEDDPLILEFLEKQWELTVPIMKKDIICRQLDASVILPFMSRELAGEGSMSTAWKVKLHQDCHQLALKDHTVIQKQINPGKHAATKFEKELVNLGLLSQLNHPNIIQLYCSYVYNDVYNFIFAVAEGGSLSSILNGKSTIQLPKGPQLILAITELASAIDSMHHFTAEIIDIQRSGCHHDLAPRNILIHDDTFLLADFGLSTFKSQEDDSKTAFKDTHGWYVAPEAQSLQNGSFTPQKIGRASDIWSFGCIISEILTYMIRGLEGVKDFRRKRKFHISPEVQSSRFYNITATPSNEVLAWLNGLREQNKELYFSRLVDLIVRMLSANQTDRPQSGSVYRSLQSILVLSLANNVMLAIGKAYMTHESINLLLEKQRFDSWLFVFICLFDESTDKDALWLDYSKTVDELKKILNIFDQIQHEDENFPRSQINNLLRNFNSSLVAALLPEHRSKVRDRLTSQVLKDDSGYHFDQLSAEMKVIGEEEIGVLLAFKHLVVLAEKGGITDNKELELDHHDIELQEPVENHHLALIKSTSVPIIVEWLRYGGSWADEEIREELSSRLTSMVSLLSQKDAAKALGSLPCRGIFHDLEMRAIGIAYNYPHPRGPHRSGWPVTLHSILTERGSPHRPLFERRFQLAFDICHSIYSVHQVGWLHRKLHSTNILLFPTDGANDSEWVNDARIIGFGSSRENELNAFTHGPDEQAQSWKYQHPDYQERFRQEFDFYSVGMILLEIGLWAGLSELTRSNRFEGLSRDGFRKEIIEQRVSKLGVAMGTAYMEATRACLDNSLARAEDSSTDATDNLCQLFKERVMDRIPLLK